MSHIPHTNPSHSPASVVSNSMERPPAYNASDDEPEGFVQQTTTTITTTTTTSFFPSFRRRLNKTESAENAAKSAENVPEIPQVSHQVQETEISSSLLIHKELPQLPEYRIGVPILKSHRSIANAAEAAERRDSAIGVTMPFALAHAAMGLNVPSVPPITPGWSLGQFSEVEDPGHYTATPRSPAQDPTKVAKWRLPLSLGTEPQATAGLDPITPNPAHVGQDTTKRSSEKSIERTTSSIWHSLPSVTPNTPLRKSRTMQHGMASTELGGSGKQITRRASWWIRRKPESPLHTASSSISSGTATEFGRMMTSTDSPVVDLSYSPPGDTPFSSHASFVAGTVTHGQSNSSSQTQSRPSQGSGDKVLSSANVHPRSSSRRPRSLSLFLRPTTSFSQEIDQPTRAQLSPTSPGPQARQRTGQTPPLLRRLSTNFFSHSPYSSTSPTPHSSLSVSGTFQTKPSEEQAASIIPRPKIDEESPEGYVQRLMEAVTKAEIAMVLASSGDEFHSKALKIYLEKFSFKGDPLDIAVRRLLMDVALPRETQQIDRVMEAFSTRYAGCNPGLFAQPDQAYILAFSLIMLHTDAFNKSNKNKMTKASYIKNTRLPGVYSEVLDYFFDNIVFAPFIFIEDPLDVNGQRGFTADSATSTSSFRSKSNKIDPYYLITSDLLDPLRIGVEKYIPRKSPYRYLGTAASWDHEELRQAFAEASVVELGDKEASHRQAAAVLMASSGFTSTAPSVFPLSFSTHAGMAPTAFNEVWTFKLTKISVINRKEDVLEGGKKSTARKWRQFKVALTGSQLLFFKDLRWDHQLSEKPGAGRVMTLPHPNFVKPDEVLSVNDAVAVLDESYIKYRHTFRLVLPKGRQYLMQVLDEHELNEWIARINYASAFRTAGLRMRATGLSGRDVELTGIAAANSHVRDTMFWQQQQTGSSSTMHKWVTPDSSTTAIVAGDDSQPFSPSLPSGPRPNRLLPASRSTARLDLESPRSNVHEEAEQMKAAFEDVKAELAASLPFLPGSSEAGLSRKNTSRSYKSSSAEKLSASPRTSYEIELPHERVSSRGNVLRLKVEELERKISALHQQLESDLRHARNLAILTPFQQTTRNRLHEQVQLLSKRVTQERLELSKLRCHREVLHIDFMADERQRYQTTRAALKVATATLKIRLGETSSQKPKPPSKAMGSSQAQQRAVAQQLRQNSFASSSSSTQGSGTGDVPSARISLELTPKKRNNRPLSATELPAVQQELPVFGLDEPSSTLEESFQENKRHSIEQAEEWNKTRAAKRVSLVTLHPDSLKPFTARAQGEEALASLRETSTIE